MLISKNKNFICLHVLVVVAVLLLYDTTTIAQEKSISLAEASDQLLGAVDTRDFSKVKLLLSSDLGRSLAKRPVGLLAAGRAIENSYYQIAHYILAVRNQKNTHNNREFIELDKNMASSPQGGFLSSKPKILLETRQYQPPKISPIKKSKFEKNRSTVKGNLGQFDKTKSSSKFEKLEDAPSTSDSGHPASKTINPFDPLNIPSATLPAVK